jgi:hypothetical protein
MPPILINIFFLPQSSVIALLEKILSDSQAQLVGSLIFIVCIFVFYFIIKFILKHTGSIERVYPFLKVLKYTLITYVVMSNLILVVYLSLGFLNPVPGYSYTASIRPCNPPDADNNPYNGCQ